jgi:hypothetical protein
LGGFGKRSAASGLTGRAGGGHCAGLLLLASTLSKVPDRAHTRITLLLPTYTTYTYLMIIPVRTAPLSFLGLHVSDTALSGGVVGRPGIYYTAYICRWVGMYTSAASRRGLGKHGTGAAGWKLEAGGKVGALSVICGLAALWFLVRWCARPSLGG